jgi:hypothetical protein
MPWWAVDTEGKTHGPFPSSREGNRTAVRALAGRDACEILDEWRHEGFKPDASEGDVASVRGVVMPPPANMPVDLFPDVGETFSRSERAWMRGAFYGTVYRTRLQLH